MGEKIFEPSYGMRGRVVKLLEHTRVVRQSSRESRLHEIDKAQQLISKPLGRLADNFETVARALEEKIIPSPSHPKKRRNVGYQQFQKRNLAHFNARANRADKLIEYYKTRPLAKSRKLPANESRVLWAASEMSRSLALGIPMHLRNDKQFSEIQLIKRVGRGNLARVPYDRQETSFVPVFDENASEITDLTVKNDPRRTVVEELLNLLGPTPGLKITEFPILPDVNTIDNLIAHDNEHPTWSYQINQRTNVVIKFLPTQNKRILIYYRFKNNGDFDNPIPVGEATEMGIRILPITSKEVAEQKVSNLARRIQRKSSSLKT